LSNSPPWRILDRFLAMRARSEEVLYYLLWTADQLTHPTLLNLTDSFEAWASRRGLLARIHYLENKAWLERTQGTSPNPQYRLTGQGRLRALGGREPPTCWSRRWDGRWRVVVFDVPNARASRRTRLRRFLRAHHLGFFQKSVWITPDPVDKVIESWHAAGEAPESVAAFEGRPAPGVPDAALVRAAWDFDEIRRRYEVCREILAQGPQGLERGAARHWLHQEQAAWLDAVDLDPLLPLALAPPGYLGVEVWELRARVLGKVLTAAPRST
jgi:phenylacetic acid degradation operon negative regulatory protein